MTSEEFRRALKAEPFVPFRVHMVSGRVLDVPHPDFAACPPGFRIAVIYDRKDRAIDNVDLLLVESIEFVKRSNDKGRRKAS